MKNLVIITLLLFINSVVFADATADLAKAVKGHNVDALKTAIAGGGDVNALDANGINPLSCAVMWPDELQVLLDAKANINQKNKSGSDALMSAAAWGQTDAIKMLLKAGADLKAVDGTGMSALSWACFSGGKADALQVLIDAGADVNHKDNAGMTPLFSLAQAGKTPSEKVTLLKSQVPYIVKAGTALPDRIVNAKESDYSSIADMMTVLINAKADVNATLPKGFTAITFAAMSGRNDAVVALVKAKADVNIKTVNGWTALCFAADDIKCQQAALALIAAGADVNVVIPFSPLGQKNGIASGPMTGTQILDKSTDVNKVTPLMLASKEGSTDLVKALINAKADVNAVADVELNDGKYTTTYRMTAVVIGHMFNHDDVVKLIVAAGAKSVVGADIAEKAKSKKK